MHLKQREREPAYTWALASDFKSLAQNQKEYSEYFKNHLLYPAENYWKAYNQIKENWKGRTASGGGLSEEKELESLFISCEMVKGQEQLAGSLINQWFYRIYGHFSDLLNDWTIGYIDDQGFKDYLLEYKKAIQKNKEIGLTSWDMPLVDSIQKNISQVLENKPEAGLLQLLKTK